MIASKLLLLGGALALIVAAANLVSANEVKSVQLTVDNEDVALNYEEYNEEIHSYYAGDISSWLRTASKRVDDYLRRVSDPEFSRTILTFKREAVYFKKYMLQLGEEIRGSKIFAINAELQQQVEKAKNFFKDILEKAKSLYDERRTSSVVNQGAKFSLDDVNHYGKLLVKAYSEAQRHSAATVKIDIQSVEIDGLNLGIIIAMYADLLTHEGLGKVVEGLTEGLKVL